MPGYLASAHVVMARATGLDPPALAAVRRGAIAEGVPGDGLARVAVPVLILSGTSDLTNRKSGRLLERMARLT